MFPFNPLSHHGLLGYLQFGTIMNKVTIIKMIVTQSCPALCDPMNCNPQGSAVHGILQERMLERVTIPFSRVPSQPRDQTRVSYFAGGFFTNRAIREAQ